MSNTKYPRGVEVVVGVFIFGPDGRVALANSPKWDAALVPPGGHVEPGETIAECAVREAYEETGLRCEYASALNIGQAFVTEKTYNRNAHLIYIHTLLRTTDSEFVPQVDEINTLEWLDPEAESTLDKLNLGDRSSLNNANAYVRGEFKLIEIKNQ